MAFRKADGRMLAMLLHFTCHPVNVFARPPGLVVSADWPGAWAAEMRAMCGESCVPLVLNGCCGNINPWPPFEPDFTPDHGRMGRALAQVAGRAIEQMRFSAEAALDWRIERVPLAVREVPSETLAAARRVIEGHPQPKWSSDKRDAVAGEWMSAAGIVSVDLMRRREPNLAYEIQALRIGDAAIVGLPGEPFVEGQLAIKIGSPAYPTYVAHCATQYVGYVPTRDACARGGHEANTSYWAKLCPEALEVVVEHAVAQLRDLWADRPQES